MSGSTIDAPERRWPGSRFAAVAVPIALVVVAALLRLPNLATRGTWDSDQGHDMLVLRSLVTDGVVPLLGPPTSIGDVHHGAWYYYLLSPAAFMTGGDSPVAVVAEIALAGIAAVLVTWWLARSIGGSVAGLVAGLLMAVSISAVDESTFIWNPNLIALSSAIALAGAWRAWSSGQPRWWLVAGIGTAITMQCHVLGVALLPIIAALFVADVRAGGRAGLRSGSETSGSGAETSGSGSETSGSGAETSGSGSETSGSETSGSGAPGSGVGESRAEATRRVWLFGLAGLAIVVLSFLPLAIHEFTTDFSEVVAALDYIRAGGDPAASGPLVRFVVIATRVASWPLTGLITDGPLAAVLATLLVVVATVGGIVLGSKPERVASRWLGLGIVWTAFALTFLSPSLATVVPGLPNDHYHAFADPMVFTLIGIGASVLWRGHAGGSGLAADDAVVADGAVEAGGTAVALADDAAAVVADGVAGTEPAKGGPRETGRVIGRGIVVVVVGAILAWNLAQQPPAVNPDGGFPAAAEAADRILAAAEGDVVTLRSLPDFKSTEAYGYPLIRAGAVVRVDTGSGAIETPTGPLVVICDSLFQTAIGAACEGPAEAVVAPAGRFGEPVLRFVAAPGRFISVYAPDR